MSEADVSRRLAGVAQSNILGWPKKKQWRGAMSRITAEQAASWESLPPEIRDYAEQVEAAEAEAELRSVT